MSTIINAIPTYILTAVISAAFYFALKQSQVFIHAKVIHAKTETSRAAWSCAAQLADNAVASLVDKDMAGMRSSAKQRTLSNRHFKSRVSKILTLTLSKPLFNQLMKNPH